MAKTKPPTAAEVKALRDQIKKLQALLEKLSQKTELPKPKKPGKPAASSGTRTEPRKSPPDANRNPPKKPPSVRSGGQSEVKTTRTTHPPTETPQNARQTPKNRSPARQNKPPPKPQPAAAGAKPRKPDGRDWYVLAVVEGKESRTMAEIRKSIRVNGLNKHLGRIYSPSHLVEVTLPPQGEVVFEPEGDFLLPKDARESGNLRAWECSGLSRFLDQSHRRSPPPGYRVRCFPLKSGSAWTYQVVKEVPGPERKAVRKRPKFPGYVVLKCKITPDTFHLITSARGVMNFLMSNEQPTPMASEEAAELYLQQRAVNKAVQDKKKGEKKVDLTFGVGDSVKVVDGTWKNQVGRVLQITGPDAEPVVTVEVSMLGKLIPVQIAHYLLVKKGS